MVMAAAKLCAFFYFLIPSTYVDAARCRDGSYSTSSGPGTCSWHGGIDDGNPNAGGGGPKSSSGTSGVYGVLSGKRKILDATGNPINLNAWYLALLVCWLVAAGMNASFSRIMNGENKDWIGPEEMLGFMFWSIVVAVLFAWSGIVPFVLDVIAQ